MPLESLAECFKYGALLRASRGPIFRAMGILGSIRASFASLCVGGAGTLIGCGGKAVSDGGPGAVSHEINPGGAGGAGGAGGDGPDAASTTAAGGTPAKTTAKTPLRPHAIQISTCPSTHPAPGSSVWIAEIPKSTPSARTSTSCLTTKARPRRMSPSPTPRLSSRTARASSPGVFKSRPRTAVPYGPRARCSESRCGTCRIRALASAPARPATTPVTSR